LIAKAFALAITTMTKRLYPAFKHLFDLLTKSDVADHGAGCGSETDLLEVSWS